MTTSGRLVLVLLGSAALVVCAVRFSLSPNAPGVPPDLERYHAIVLSGDPDLSLGSQLLAYATARRELGITTEQERRMAPTRQALREAMQRYSHTQPGGPDDLHVMMNRASKAQEAYQRCVVDTLTASQKARLVQIALQASGPSALLRSDLAKKVQISAEQRARIARVLSEHNQQLAASAPDEDQGGSLASKQQGLVARVGAAQEATAEDILRELTPPQIARWRQMLGRPVTLGAPDPEPPYTGAQR